MRVRAGARARLATYRGGPRLTGWWPLAVYGALLFALFVRFVDPAITRRPLQLRATPAELRLVRIHHRLFYAILIAAPIEWALRGRPAGCPQLLAAALFLAGVIGYRRAGAALGEQLSPLLAPREPAALVERGPYRHVRHPMYGAQLAMALGAPLTLGAVATSALALGLALVLRRRMAIEERLLGERLPAYDAYVRRTSRLVPRVY